MWDDKFRQNLVPQQAYMTSTYCNKEGVSFKDLPEGQLNGLIRLQIRYDLYNKAFRDGDTRKDASMTQSTRNSRMVQLNILLHFVINTREFYLMELHNVAS